MAPVENQLQATLAKLQELKRKEANQQHQVQSGTTQWQGQLRASGLPDTLQPLQLKEILQRTGRITDTDSRLSALRSELENRNKELNTLRSQVSSLLHDCGLETEESNILDLLQQIRESISEHRTLINKKKELVNKYRSLGKHLSKFRDKLKDCRQKKQQLLSIAGVTTESDYLEMATRLSKRENLTEQKQHLTTQISTVLGPHFSEAEAAELLDQDQDDHCEKNLEHVQNKLKRNQEQQTELNQRFGESSLEQKMLAENSRLDEARLELSAIECQIKEHQQQWRILATSSQMLESIRDDYEAKRQPETLRNASNYLQQLTDGKYQRIWTPMEGKQLLCDTNNNETLTVDKLSRGTREAVFLSLRLSLVDAYAKRGKTLPMVLDDVLVNFDSQRGDAAAKLLCDFSNRGHQVLIFTCHEHIAQLFHQKKASVKTLPHHSDVANARTTPSDFSSNPVHNRTAPPTIPTNSNWSQIEIENFDPELEFELAAVEQDERASQKLNQELVYYFNEENPAVKLTDLNIAWSK